MQKDLRNIFLRCIQRAPSIIVFENLDSLVKATSDQVQSGEYYGHVSDMLRHFISMYTNQFCISVIATVSDLNNLNHRLYNVRGNILFGKIYRISSLSRVKIRVERFRFFCELTKRRMRSRCLGLAKFRYAD